VRYKTHNTPTMILIETKGMLNIQIEVVRIFHQTPVSPFEERPRKRQEDAPDRAGPCFFSI